VTFVCWFTNNLSLSNHELKLDCLDFLLQTEWRKNDQLLVGRPLHNKQNPLFNRFSRRAVFPVVFSQPVHLCDLNLSLKISGGLI
jgi:hypothetical protein